MMAWVMMAALSGVPTAPVDKAAVEASTRAWQTQRLARLTSETGWLTLVGLVWLREGTLTAGTAAGKDLTLPAGMPPSLGTFTLQPGGSVLFSPDAGAHATLANGKTLSAPVTLQPDAAGEPTLVRVGTFSFFVIKRGDKTGLRIRNTDAETRKSFKGIEMFAPNPAWVLTAQWKPFPSPQKLKVPNVLGQVEEMESPGVAVFTVDGKEMSLQPVLEDGPDSKEMFFIFSDETSRKETYGAGRFFYSALPRNGVVTLDFNQAYNPPCAFTPFATCPVPPSQNRLPVRVEAGEKRYGNH